MTPRRHRSASNVSSGNAVNVQTVRPQRNQSPIVSMQQPNRHLGMTPAIYENNMKVLLRREPSIISIFDQFSHVCVYHHNGSKWEKQGFEGSMFLFEKQTYPPYGFFILNRMGTDDYSRPIHPEDDMDVMGDYLMYRYYPKFTQTRIAMGLPYPIPPERRAALDAELLRQMTPEEVAASRAISSSKEWRGSSVTIGLWMFATDAREPLKDVMMRLHSYIKQGKAYPEEFRYGPGRPPPPNPHLRTASRGSSSQDDQQTPDSGTHLPSSRSVSRSQFVGAPSADVANTAGSDLDKLFAKLMPSAPSTPAPEVQPPATTSTSTMTVNDLFAALGGHELTQTNAPSASASTGRGLALLDSIFASASASTGDFSSGSSFVYPQQVPTIVQSNTLPLQPEDIQIVSPKPKSSVLPQILNQDVISSLLGLGPDSRASSAAPSSSGSRRSGQNRYEGDNEYSEGELTSESEYSTSSTVLDAETDPAILAAGSSSGLPLLAVQRSEANSGRNSRIVEGDVTPRAVVRGIGPLSPPLQPQLPPPHEQYFAPPSLSTSSTVNSHAPQTNAPRPRALVPFEADSDLWPYPRAPLDDRSLERDDADVVELDFADTRALSDPAMFSSRLKEKKSRANGKKTRKERAADREREREEIERSWDDPVRGHAQDVGPAYQSAVRPALVVNGVHGGEKTANVSGTGKKMANGVSKPSPMNGDVQCLQNEAAREAVVSAVSSQPTRPDKEIPRNEFVRELLTLIHTDKSFVDRLWHDYVERVG